MTIFYIATAIAMILCLVAATILFVASRNRVGEWWLVAFLISLVSNTVWALFGPFCAGLEMWKLVGVMDAIARSISLAGYVCLLCFAIWRKRESRRF